MKKIFVAATRQNEGKTVVSLGLIAHFSQQWKVGYIKPIGQRYLEEQGYKVDEDSVLIERACGINCHLRDMSPIAVEKGFTESHIRGEKKDLPERILNSFARVSQNRDLVVIEGTGHAGVGSVFDLSNATVARLLGAKVLLVSGGGIGRAIDEIVLNKALFEKEGAELLGVVVNKVFPEKYDKINQLLRKGLEKRGIKVWGVIPFHSLLTWPTLWQILEELGGEIVCGGDELDRMARKMVVGAMEPHHALSYFEDESLVITPGDREDIILAAISTLMVPHEGQKRLVGMVWTGGLIPHYTILELVKKCNLPVILVEHDTYTTASKINDLTVKIRPVDREKIQAVIKLVEDYLAMEILWEML